MKLATDLTFLRASRELRLETIIAKLRLRTLFGVAPTLLKSSIDSKAVKLVEDFLELRSLKAFDRESRRFREGVSVTLDPSLMTGSVVSSSEVAGTECSSMASNSPAGLDEERLRMDRRRFLGTSFIRFELEVTFACLGLTMLRSVSELQRFMHRVTFGAPEKLSVTKITTQKALLFFKGRTCKFGNGAKGTNPFDKLS